MAETTATFSESWYRVANQRLSLRPVVKVRRQNYRGERWYVLEDPFSNRFFRLRPAAYEFVARLRPEKTVEEVWKECLSLFPDEAPGQEAVIQLLAQLYFGNLLQYDLAADTTKLFERYKKTTERETRMRLQNIMFMRFPLLDPDQFLVRTLPVIKHLISALGALVWLVVVGLALKVVVDNLPALRQESANVLDPNNLFLFYVGLVVVKALHEFGHAYFCRRFGGEVHVIGVMLLIFTPIPYMDASSSWGFRERYKRVLVGSAGMIVELFVAALATFVWANTGTGTLHGLAYNMMFVASVSTIVFNLNPLLRYDGYYILSDLLEIPNLNQRALLHLRHLVEHYLFGVKRSESPAETRKEATWLTVYGITSSIYRVIVFGGILVFVADRLLLLGIIMGVICLISWVVVPLFRFSQYLSYSPRLERCRLRAAGVSASLLVAIVLCLQVIPFGHHFRAPGVLEARHWSEVINNAAGEVESLLAQPGSKVTSGQPLIQLRNRELELGLVAARASKEEMQSRLLQAMQQDMASLRPLQSRLDSAEKKLQRLLADQAALVIKARQGGVWVAPRVEENVGRWLARGTSLGLVIDPSSFEFKATVGQEDADALFASKVPGAEVRLRGQASQAVRASQVKVIPVEQRNLPSAALGWKAGGDVAVSMDDRTGRQAAEPAFEVRADVQPVATLAFLHGRAGKIRFDLGREPLLPRWIRRFRQVLQQRYQL